MAIASVGSLGTAGVDSGGGNLVLTTSATLEAGNFALFLIGKDNDAAADGSTSEITSVSDSAGNSYSHIRAYINGSGGADTAAGVEIWGGRATNQLNSGGTVTIVKATDCDACVLGWEFTVGAALQLVGTPQTSEAGAEPAALTLSSLPNKEYLFIRAHATEGEATTAWTNTASYTDLGVKESTVTGAADANMTIRGEFRILTGTGDTSDPSASLSGDTASLYIALEEVTAAAGGPPNLLLLGVG